MMRQWWLGAVVCFSLTSALLARQGVVRTDDGRVLAGDVDDSAGAATRPVMITLHGVKTTIPRTQVVSIVYSNDAGAALRDRLKTLPGGDVQGRLDVAAAALDAQDYSLASEAVESARNIDPHNPDVTLMSETIKRQEALNSKRGTGTSRPSTPAAVVAANPPAATGPSSAGATTNAAAEGGKYLNDAQINSIRQVELRADDDVRVEFLNNVRRRYLAGGGINANDYMGSTPAAQAYAIIHTADPAMLADVKILSDPMALLEFRNRIQLRVEVGCAAAGCHGGNKGGSFFLYSDARTTAASYTNFYLLQTYKIKLDSGTGYGKGPAQYTMIDRIHPNSSLLTEYALPTTVAILPHPKVLGMKPMCSGQTDLTYIAIQNWITNTLKQIEPDYGFEFHPAMRDAMPASAPAAASGNPAPSGQTAMPAASAPADANSAQPVAPAQPAAPSQPGAPAGGQ